MRCLAAVAFALVSAASAAAMSGPGVVNFPVTPVTAVGDAGASGSVSTAIGTLGSPDFCWEISMSASSQVMFVYLRRKRTGRVVARIDTRDNHVPTQPWPGSGGWSGCVAIKRVDERAYLRDPSLYYLDVRTQAALHAARVNLHGPRL